MVESYYERLVDACKVYRGSYYGAKFKNRRRGAAKADFKDRWQRAQKAFDERDEDRLSQGIVMNDTIAGIVVHLYCSQEEAAKLAVPDGPDRAEKSEDQVG